MSINNGWIDYARTHQKDLRKYLLSKTSNNLTVDISKYILTNTGVDTDMSKTPVGPG